MARSPNPDRFEEEQQTPAFPRRWGLASFQTGELLAGRYRILRFLAGGGMGEVYEAFDTELKERIALKAIHARLAEDDRSLDRFRREIQLARKVAHPNVCRTFDSAVHLALPTSPGLEAPRQLLLTMELLQGETLWSRLQREGPMSRQEALPWVRQMAGALQAAHDAGVLHRDFKSRNVLLCGTRAVVTDFGLARGFGEESHGSQLSSAGVMLGTPATMAPEQVLGAPLSPATDVYALGVVLYEMLTGQLPFEGENSMATALQRLHRAPVSLRKLVPDLSPAWDSVVLRCLEKDPADRYSSAAEVLAALEADSAPSGWRLRRKTVRRLTAVMACLSLLLAGSWFLAGWKPAFLPRRTVAVLGFKDLSQPAEALWISTALAEMLSTELSVPGSEGASRLRVVPGENVARMKSDLNLLDSDSLAPDTLARIGLNLGADLVVLGSYRELGDAARLQEVRLDLRLQSTKNGETLLAVVENGWEDRLDELAARVGARLRQELGAGSVSATESAKLRVFLPDSPEATRLYAEGLARLRLFDARDARELLERAVAADPRSPLLHLALAQARTALGYDSLAQESALRAFELSSQLPRAERLLVEGRYRESMRDWDKAINLYKALFTVFPDEVEHGLRLVRVLASAGRGPEAFATVEELRDLSAGTDPRVALAEAEAAWMVSNFARSRAAASEALRQGLERGARQLVAEARYWQGLAMQEEDPRLAQQALEEAIQIWSQSGNRRREAEALLYFARVRWLQGDLPQATHIVQAGLEISRDLGLLAAEARGTRLLGLLLAEQGRLTEARALYEASLVACREARNHYDEAWALNNLGDVFWKQGELQDALHHFRLALNLWTQQGNESGIGIATVNLGEAYFDLGRLDEALLAYQKAARSLPPVGSQMVRLYSLHGEGKVLFARGDLEGARNKFLQSREIRIGIGQQGWAAQSLLALAAVDLETDAAPRAEAFLREALAVFHESNMGYDEALGRALLARSLQAQGRSAEALQEVLQAEAKLQGLEFRGLRIGVRLALATVHTARSSLADARRDWSEALELARQGGYQGFELEARLGLALLDGSTRKALSAVEQDARAAGFGRLATQAAVARGQRDS